ncbi:ATP-binding protein [Nonomuraea mangrovi]|uniref:Oxygen sensor histidine kinase NreB n=1 Tax=Nonomuraea mangrovi TaxID=2316207 RepID=A0ABW4TCG4_9ACTN
MSGAVSRAIATWLAVAVAVETALSGLLFWRSGLPLAELVDGNGLTAMLAGLSTGAVGAFVVRRTPGNALGWVFVGCGQSEALASIGWSYHVAEPGSPLDGVAAWVGAYAWMPGFLMFAGLVTVLYPDGRPAWRPLAWASGLCCAIATLTASTLQGPMAGIGPRAVNPLAPGGGWEQIGEGVTLAFFYATVVCGLAGGVLLVVRTLRATGVQRRRLAWFCPSVVLAIVAALLPGGTLPNLLSAVFFPIGLGVAMVRHRLFDGDRLLNRTLVYTALTLLVAGVFGLGVGLASAALGGPGVGAVLAAVVITLGLSPARTAVQQVVDRLLYGARRDPYQALTDLGQRLSAALAPEEVLPIIVRTVAGALRQPYVAVRLVGESAPAAAFGTAGAAAVDVPLRHAGEDVGVLALGQPVVDPGDERLLLDFAQRAGTAAHAVRLTHELRRSRDNLLIAREEERHRISRDLHDGLGPALAGVALGLDAARRSASSEQAAELLTRLEREVKDGLENVKRLVSDLRPTLLEQCGLVEALRRHCEMISARGLLQAVLEIGELPPLPPDVEVAACRIALEALTNATRHARATRCTVHVSATGAALHLSVRDDGTGIPPDLVVARGLGLASMRERAAELGGECLISDAPGGGTLVSAALPLTSPAAGPACSPARLP